MSANFPWLRFTGLAIGLMGFGYVLMKATIPSEEETYNAMAADLRRKVDANRAARLAREDASKQQLDAQTKQADPDTAKPIWADHSPPKQ